MESEEAPVAGRGQGRGGPGKDLRMRRDVPDKTLPCLLHCTLLFRYTVLRNTVAIFSRQKKKKAYPESLRFTECNSVTESFSEPTIQKRKNNCI